MNRKIGSYGRYYCLCSLDSSLYLLLPLVFTATVLEISLFQAPKRQYSSFEKVQVSKNFPGVDTFLEFFDILTKYVGKIS